MTTPSNPAQRPSPAIEGLLPCPFCGGKPHQANPEHPHGGMVHCDSCGAEAFGPKWNTRAAPAYTVPIPPIPIEWARPQGETFEEMRANVWKNGLAAKGDTILVWVNEGDFWHACMVCGAKEHTSPIPSPERP